MFGKKSKIECKPDPETGHVKCEKYIDRGNGQRETLASADFACNNMGDKIAFNLNGDPDELEDLDRQTNKLVKCKVRNSPSQNRPADY